MDPICSSPPAHHFLSFALPLSTLADVLDISCMAKNMNNLVEIFSGSMDGDIRLWDIASRTLVCTYPHKMEWR
ncbi:hypothetical protein ACLB2K_004495 [Fragaria x ananassa]